VILKYFFIIQLLLTFTCPGKFCFFREDKRVCTSSSVQKTEKTLFGFAKKTHILIIRFVIKQQIIKILSGRALELVSFCCLKEKRRLIFT
jgi:hypothetical protein